MILWKRHVGVKTRHDMDPQRTVNPCFLVSCSDLVFSHSSMRYTFNAPLGWSCSGRFLKYGMKELRMSYNNYLLLNFNCRKSKSLAPLTQMGGNSLPWCHIFSSLYSLWVQRWCAIFREKVGQCAHPDTKQPQIMTNWVYIQHRFFLFFLFSLLLLELCGFSWRDWCPRRKGRKNQLTVLKTKQNSTKVLSSSRTIPMESKKWAHLELPDCKTMPLLLKRVSFSLTQFVIIWGCFVSL